MTIDDIMRCFRGWLDRDWRTKEQCLAWMKDIFKTNINERELRDVFSRYCCDFIAGKHDSYLAHSYRGYLLTSDPEIIKQSIKDDEARMIALSKRVYGVKRRLKELDQITLLPENDKEMEAYEIISRMELE